MTRKESRSIDRLVTRLLTPVDAASLVAFRIGFGLIMTWWCFDDWRTGRVRELYIAPRFHFTYYLFDFVHPWPGGGMYLFFLVLCVLATFIALGFLYRIAAPLFAVGFTYFFLLERTNYQNHYYLLCLLSWVLAFLPLNRAASFDVLTELTRPSPVLPRWSLWFLRFHVALPYLFGGLSKLYPDWFAGEPIRTHLASRGGLPIVGQYLKSELAVSTFVWGGLLFDLAIVPLLLWRRSRIVAYVLCVLFHLVNAVLFEIHVFPWFMIFATTIFFEPDWPRRLCGEKPLSGTLPSSTLRTSLSFRGRVLASLLVLYCTFHIAWPLRHYFYAGDAAWTEQGHYFSWRMMTRSKVSAVRYYVTDLETGKTKIPSLRPYLNLDQVTKFSRDPEMILQLAHFLAREYRTQTGHQAEVHALVLTSLNGRKPQLLIDPNVDLANEPLGLHYRPWIMPLTEPLRAVAWSVPMMEWERYVDVPPLTFIKSP